ncbi:MAG: metallophosphoesterase [Victivallaceae bacterium]|nr:metallophosphoesterase [Victivallaceae bacterium]
MSTFFLGLDFSGKKFAESASEWQQVNSYKQRRVLRSGEYVDLVGYEIHTAMPKNKGRTLLWFSDLHFWGNLETDEKVAAESSVFINELQPDYLVCGGDVIMYSSALPKVRTFLQSLPAKSGKMAIPGNWEHAKKWLRMKDWRNFYDQAGFSLLVNAGCSFDEFFFYGTDDLRKGKASGPEEIPPGREAVFLTHSPDAFVHISTSKILEQTTLVMCGHTHGGQIRLPLWGALLTSSRYWRKFDYGHFVNSQSGSNMIVSSGLGCSTISLRIACRRELVLVNFV